MQVVQFELKGEVTMKKLGGFILLAVSMFIIGFLLMMLIFLLNWK